MKTKLFILSAISLLIAAQASYSLTQTVVVQNLTKYNFSVANLVTQGKPGVNTVTSTSNTLNACKRMTVTMTGGEILPNVHFDLNNAKGHGTVTVNADTSENGNTVSLKGDETTATPNLLTLSFNKIPIKNSVILYVFPASGKSQCP